MQTVENLRKSGWKVRVLHYRNDESCEGKVKSSHSKEYKINPKGGKTVVILDSPFGEHFEGLAICNAGDLYNKKIGVKIAIGRALFSKDEGSIENIHDKWQRKIIENFKLHRKEVLETFCEIAGKLAILKGKIANLPVSVEVCNELREIINDCQEIMAIKADVAPIRLISGEFLKNPKAD
jgi:hypothetical protein